MEAAVQGDFSDVQASEGPSEVRKPAQGKTLRDPLQRSLISSGSSTAGSPSSGGPNHNTSWKDAPVQMDADAHGVTPTFANKTLPGLSVQLDEKTAVQLDVDGASSAKVHDAAAAGISGAGGTLPHANKIQASFGSYDIGGISAHTDSHAAEATTSMGANAYATGNHVAFAPGKTDLHTAAHEAAHVVQQSAGVQLSGGVGQASDKYERHADAVADKVVAGQSAEGLLSKMTGGASAPATTVQFDFDDWKEKVGDPAEFVDNSVGAADQVINAVNAPGQVAHEIAMGKYAADMGAYSKSKEAWDAQEAYSKTWTGWASQKLGLSAPLPDAPTKPVEPKFDPVEMNTYVKGAGGAAGVVAGGFEVTDGVRDLYAGNKVDGGLKVVNGLAGSVDGAHAFSEALGMDGGLQGVGQAVGGFLGGWGDTLGGLGETAGKYAGTLGSAVQGLQGAKSLMDIAGKKAVRNKLQAFETQANGKAKDAVTAMLKHEQAQSQDGNTGTIKGVGGVIGGIGAGVATFGAGILGAPLALTAGAGMMALGKGTAALKGVADMVGYKQASDTDKQSASDALDTALSQAKTDMRDRLYKASDKAPIFEENAKLASAAKHFDKKFEPIQHLRDHDKPEWQRVQKEYENWL